MGISENFLSARNGSAMQSRGERVNRSRGMGKPSKRFTMSESTLAAVVTTTETRAREEEETRAQEAQEEEEREEEEQEEQAQEEQEDKRLSNLLKKAESAFVKGNKGLLLSGVECGKWCHAIYVLR